MKKAILTGFGPFGNYEFNPTQDVVKEWDGKKLGNIEITGLVLPGTYYGAFDVLSEKIDSLAPDIVLSTGLASRVRGIRFETIGRNIMDGRYPDANGFEPKGKPIIPGAKEVYSINTNAVRLADMIYKNEIPSEVSEDAEFFFVNL